MAIPPFVLGLPGVRQAVQAAYRTVFRQGGIGLLAAGKVIDGTRARDPEHVPDVAVLRAGLLLGKITASGKYANSVISQLTANAASGATSITITTNGARELVRRIGSSGTLRLIGPPTAGGAIAINNVSYTAVNVSTGVVTTAALPAAYIAQSFVTANDGSEFPITFVPDGYGIAITRTGEEEGTAQDVPDAEVAVSGVVESAKLIPWPTEVSLQNWVTSQLSSSSGGKFSFSHVY